MWLWAVTQFSSKKRADISMPDYTMRYSSYVGFVSPPNSFDNSPQHFLQLVDGDTVGVTQHVVHMPDFEYVGLSEHDSNAAAVELESFENGGCGTGRRPGGDCCPGWVLLGYAFPR